jgi:hypothetical protein
MGLGTAPAMQDGRIYIEKINGPFLFELKGTPAEYKAGLERAIAKGWRHLRSVHRRRRGAVRLIPSACGPPTKRQW